MQSMERKSANDKNNGLAVKRHEFETTACSIIVEKSLYYLWASVSSSGKCVKLH